MYDVILSPQALVDIGNLKMSEPKSYPAYGHYDDK